MAMVFNPVTGQMEDDGLGESAVGAPPSMVDPSLPPEPVIQPVANFAGEGGGAPLGSEGNPMTAVIAPRPKPPVEIVTKGSAPVVTAAEKQAVTQNADAEQRVAKSIEAEGELNAQSATEIDQPLADAKLKALTDQKANLARIKEEEERELQNRSARERQLAENTAKANIAAGRARADFFKGSFVGEIVAALVQSVAAGFHAQAGKSGMSPAERIFENAYNNHEKALLAEYENSKQAQEDFKNDRARYDAKIAAKKVEAANNAQADLQLALANADKAIAKLAPEKAAIATQQKLALEERGNARAELERAKGLRGVTGWEKTQHPLGSGAADPNGGKPTEGTRNAAGQGNLILESVQDALKAPAISKEGLAKLNQNRGRKRMAEKAPLLDAMGVPLTPPEGDTQGLSDGDKQAIASSSVLTDTITYLTSGAAVTPEEAARKLDQTRITESDSPAVRKTKLGLAIRFAEAAATKAGPNWTPQHAQTLADLKVAVGQLGASTPKASGPKTAVDNDPYAGYSAAELKEGLKAAAAAKDRTAIQELNDALKRKGAR